MYQVCVILVTILIKNATSFDYTLGNYSFVLLYYENKTNNPLQHADHFQLCPATSQT